MKIIDEKGRLFGKINLIDFLVILLLLCILPMFYYGHKILTKKPDVEAPKREFVEIETSCQLVKLKPELLKVISASDKELGENGELIGEIISLGQIKPYKYEFGIGEETKIIKEDTGLKQIEAKLRLKAEIKKDKIYYKNKLIKIDLPLKFKTNKYDVIAVPFTVKKEKEKEQEVIVRLKVKFKSLLPEIAEAVKPGDRQIEIAEGNNKWIVAKLTRIISNDPTEAINLVHGKDWFIEGHPEYRDLVLEIESFCMRKPGGFFLKDKPLKAGKYFEFSPDLYSISGLIIGIEPK